VAAAGSPAGRRRFWFWPRTQIERAVLVLAAAGMVLVGTLWAVRLGVTQATAAPRPRTVPVGRGEIVATVSAVGQTVPAAQARLAFRNAGRLRELNVQLGQRVKAGEVLARLDTADLEAQLAQAEANVKIQRLRLEALQAGPRAEEVAAARAAYDAAVATYERVRQGPTPAEIRAAEAAVESARAQLESARAQLQSKSQAPLPNDVAAAEAAVAQAQAALDAAEAAYQLKQQSPTAADLRAAEAAVAQAEAAVAKAQAEYDARASSDAVAADLKKVEADVAAAELALENARKNLDDLRAKPRPQDVQAAQAAVYKAAVALQKAEADLFAASGRDQRTRAPLEQAVAQARAELAAAEANLAKVNVPASPAELAAAEKAVSVAEANLAVARARLESWRSGADREQARLNLESAKAALASARARYEQVKAGPAPAELAAAEQQVKSARAALASAQARLDYVRTGAPEAELEAARRAVEAAEANLAAAQARLEQLRAGPLEADLRVAQANLQAAKAQMDAKLALVTQTDIALQMEQVRQAEAAYQLARWNLENAILTAPFDGVVAALGANPGEIVTSTTPIVTLVNSAEVRVDVMVDEVDVARLDVGKEAIIQLDALPGKQFRGRVVGISPNAIVQQGFASYLVTLAVEGEQLPPRAGLAASVTIITDKKSGVLTVPTRALRAVGKERLAEVLLPNGRTETRTVRIGMSNEQLAEVLEGLKEGEQVLVSNLAPGFLRSLADQSQRSSVSQP
jgi:HlyD family secretion protein